MRVRTRVLLLLAGAGLLLLRDDKVARKRMIMAYAFLPLRQMRPASTRTTTSISLATRQQQHHPSKSTSTKRSFNNKNHTKDFIRNQPSQQQIRSTTNTTFQKLAALIRNDDWDSVFALLQTSASPSLANVTVSTSDRSLVAIALCRKGDWKQALALGGNLNVAAYDAILSCIKVDWKQAVRLLRTMQLTNTTKPAVSTYRTVVECCLRAGQEEQAIQVLRECVKQDLTPTARAFELVIVALCKKLQWRGAMQMMEWMKELNVLGTSLIYNAVLTACAKAGEVRIAKNLLLKMKKDGFQPNVMSYNCVIAAAANQGRWKDALAVLDACQREPGVAPDIYTYTNAIRACAKGGMMKRALSLLQVANDKMLPVDSYCYTAAIEACAKANDWRKALNLLNEMENRGILPTGVTYSVTISACGNGGQWQKALKLLDVMRAKQMKINLITYNAAITALSKAAKQLSKSPSGLVLVKDDHNDKQLELWKIAMSLLERIKEDGIEPDGFSFSAAISCCGSQGRWKEALELLEIMRAGGPRMRPNKIAYTATISSCGRSGQADEAIRLFRQMKDEGLAADLVAYNALFSSLRVAGRPEAAWQLWNEMIGKVSRGPTSRWRSRTNSFHPYCVLKKLDNGTDVATSIVRSASPDIITLSEAVATIADVGKVDIVFEQAVERGIILRTDTLDSIWEVDLTSMPLPVARAAVRYILRQALAIYKKGEMFEDVAFITGVGNNHDAEHPSLHDYVEQLLRTDFNPPLSSTSPRFASGTVLIEKETLKTWAQEQFV
jgi:pentatricopeptide repeat protein